MPAEAITEDSLVTATVLNQEVTSRKASDLNLASFIGQPVDVNSEPVSVSPSYASLIDLLNDESLTASVARLDRGKNSRQVVTTVDFSSFVNPRFVRFSMNAGNNGLIRDTSNLSVTGYRINVNTISTVPFVTNVRAVMGMVSIIKASAYAIVAVDVSYDYVRLTEFVQPT